MAEIFQWQYVETDQGFHAESYEKAGEAPDGAWIFRHIHSTPNRATIEQTVQDRAEKVQSNHDERISQARASEHSRRRGRLPH